MSPEVIPDETPTVVRIQQIGLRSSVTGSIVVHGVLWHHHFVVPQGQIRGINICICLTVQRRSRNPEQTKPRGKYIIDPAAWNQPPRHPPSPHADKITRSTKGTMATHPHPPHNLTLDLDHALIEPDASPAASAATISASPAPHSPHAPETPRAVVSTRLGAGRCCH